MTIRVAVAQYDVPSTTELSLKKLGEIAQKASRRGVQLLVVPETAIGSAKETWNSGVDYLPPLVSLVKENRLYIATSFTKKDGDKVYNQGYIVSEKGELLHTYRKIYLAKPDVEDDKLSHGNELTVSNTDLGRLGMIICKDGFNKYSHFLYQKLNDLTADITCVPTWSLGWSKTLTLTGKNIKHYIKACSTYGAFISRSFMLLAGNLNKETLSFGHSLIISPISGILQEGSETEEQILIQDIDLNEVNESRSFDSWWQPEKRII